MHNNKNAVESVMKTNNIKKFILTNKSNFINKFIIKNNNIKTVLKNLSKGIGFEEVDCAFTHALNVVISKTSTTQSSTPKTHEQDIHCKFNT